MTSFRPHAESALSPGASFYQAIVVEDALFVAAQVDTVNESQDGANLLIVADGNSPLVHQTAEPAIKVV